MIVRLRRWKEMASLTLLSLGVSATSALAAGGGGALPWDAPITTLQTDATGPVATAFTVGAILITGVAWSHMEHVRHVGA